MMYRNGQVPFTVVSVVLGTGRDANGYWEFRCTPAFAARWAYAKREAERRFGRTIFIRTGWNIYRPLNIQREARERACAQGNCNGASVAGYSSHGGNWGGRDCLAVDVDPNGLTWDQVDVAMEAAGFAARMITEAMSGIRGGERWHYIDFNAFGPVPIFAGFDATTFEEDDMYDAAAEKRLMEKLDQVARVAAPLKMYTYGSGIVAVNPLTGGWSILGPGYPEVLNHLGLAAGGYPRVDEGQFGYATQYIPNTVGIPSLDEADGFSADDLAAIKAAIEQNRVALTQEQLDALTAAVAAGAREGGEGGARAAVEGLTFVVKTG